MKEVRIDPDTGKPKTGNVITGDDIDMSSPFLGQDLTTVLTSQQEQIERLTRNIKYLTKYGGSGGTGTGSGGSGKIKTRFVATITYTNLKDVQLTENVRADSFFTVKPGTKIAVTIVLTSTATLNSYSARLTVGRTVLRREIKGSEKTTTIEFIPETNTPCTVMVSGETSMSIEFGLYLSTSNFVAALYNGDVRYGDNQEVYRSVLESHETRFLVRLENYLPGVVTDDALVALHVGDTTYPVVNGELKIGTGTWPVKVWTDKETGTQITQVEVQDCLQIFGEYGIYRITADYQFNGVVLSSQVNYIYKTREAFVYAFSKSGYPVIYQTPQTSPDYTTGYTENFVYRIYGRSGLGSSVQYNTWYTIFKEGDETLDNELRSYYNQENLDSPAGTEKVGTTYYEEYSQDGGKIIVSGASENWGPKSSWRVTVTQEGEKYRRRLEIYSAPTLKGTDSEFPVSFANLWGPRDFEYRQVTGEPKGPRYRKIGESYVFVTDPKPNPSETYYEVVPKRVEVKFVVTDPLDSRETEKTYYVYVGRTRDLEYVFTGPTGKMYYGAVHSCTTDLVNTVMDFPWVNGKFSVTSEVTYRIKPDGLCRGALYFPNQADGVAPTVRQLVSGAAPLFSFGSIPESKPRRDGMFSFGLRYYSDNYDDPVIRVHFDSETSITLYKTKLVVTSGSSSQEYRKFVFPSDGQYHLIGFYYKSDYTFSGGTAEKAQGATPSVLVFIDGIAEVAPISLPRAELGPSTGITWYPGQWDFNFAGVMTFNGKPGDIDRFDQVPNSWTGVGLIRKYYHDFDMVIPSNYYQTYREYLQIQSGRGTTGMTAKFDSGIYDTLGDTGSWVNWYNGKGATRYDKFVKVNDLGTIADLTDLPVYLIRLESTSGDTNINSFVASTLESYSENAETPVYECHLEKLVRSGDTWRSAPLFEGDVRYQVKYQGSSTLLYGVKNFYIETIPVTEGDTKYQYYWTPDIEKFKPELGFNLKADLVDSSHSNNVVIGNFVNDYFKDDENPGFGKKSEGIRNCLTGTPVILMMTDSTTGSSGNNLFMGIYNLNLGRGSVMNLGYQALNTGHDQCSPVKSEVPGVIGYKVGPGAVNFPSHYVVAEVQGNNRTLFDYSQTDRGILKNQMLGDWFGYNGSEFRTYSEAVEKALRGLGKLVYHDIIGPNVFEPLSLDPKLLEEVPGTGFHYYNSAGTPTLLDDPEMRKHCIRGTTIDTLGTYSTYVTDSGTGLKIGVVGNPKLQFHLLTNSNGGTQKDVNGDTWYYVEELTNPPKAWSRDIDDKFDYPNALKYYMVCMAFAMVDSVQKNLTLKCRNFNENGPNTWYLGFYDMDTAFGEDNSGGSVDFRAFSDYITKEGEIIQDYSPSDVLSAGTEGSLFDTPSSFLFLYAKYGNILRTDRDNNPITNQGPKDLNPLKAWIDLRKVGGVFETARGFCEHYVNRYFGNINPLLWNLNYSYKYFSQSKNSNASDTEVSKFNGTMKHRREYWLDNRFKILDVLFGINRDARIGRDRDNRRLHGGSDEYVVSIDNNDVEIAQTMFPGFTKGYPPTSFSCVVSGEPRTPVVFRTAATKDRMYIIRTSGKSEQIEDLTTSNTDCGFYGTRLLTGLTEFGQFLRKPNTENRVVGPRLTRIDIRIAGTTGQRPELVLKLSELGALRSIVIDLTGNPLNKYYLGIQIVNSGISRTLERIILKGVEAGDVSIVSSDTTSLTVGNLEISECVFDRLTVRGVTVVSQNKFKDNRIKEYTLLGIFQGINLNDPVAKSVEINTGGSKEIGLTFPEVVSLTVGGNVSYLIYNNMLESSIRGTTKTVNLGNLNCGSVSVTGTTIESILIPAKDREHLYLNLNSNPALKLIQVDAGPGLKRLMFGNNMFQLGHPDLKFEVRRDPSGSFVDLPEVPISVIYTGPFAHFWGSLPARYIYQTKRDGAVFKIGSGRSFTGFMGQQKSFQPSHGGFSLADVTKLFKTIELDLPPGTKNVALDHMFIGINFPEPMSLIDPKTSEPVAGALKGDVDYVIPDSYQEFLGAFSGFVRKLKGVGVESVSMNSMFSRTNFALFTKDFLKVFNDAGISFGTDYNDWFGSADFKAVGDRYESTISKLFVEKGVFEKFETVIVGQLDVHNWWRIPGVVLFERTSTPGRVRISTKPKASDPFGDSPRVKKLSRFGFYTSPEFVLDCSEGLPGTIEEVSDFCIHSSGFWATDVHDLFKNLRPGSKVWIDKFLAHSTGLFDQDSKRFGEPLDLYKFLVNPQTMGPRFTVGYQSTLSKSPGLTGTDRLPGGLSHRTVENTIGFMLPKKITGQNLTKILELIKHSESWASFRPDMSWLFSNTHITQSSPSETWAGIMVDMRVTGRFDTGSTEYVSLLDPTTGFKEISVQETPLAYRQNSKNKLVRIGEIREWNGTYYTPYLDLSGNMETVAGGAPKIDTGNTVTGKVWVRTYLKGVDDGRVFDGLFYRCRYTNAADSEEWPISPGDTFNDPSYGKVRSLANAFVGCKISRMTRPLGVVGVYSMYRTFWSARFVGDPPETLDWSGSTTSQYLPSYRVTSKNGSFPIIPDRFFDVCESGVIDECFAGSGWSPESAQGQIWSSNKQCPWWTREDAVKSHAGLLRKTRAHPWKDEENGVWRIFPKWYTDLGITTDLFIPIFTVTSSTSTDRLVIFEPGTTGVYGRLPSLPNHLTNLTDAVQPWKTAGRPWAIRLTDTVGLPVPRGTSMKGILPRSLAYVMSTPAGGPFSGHTRDQFDGNHPVLDIGDGLPGFTRQDDYSTPQSLQFLYWKTDDDPIINTYYFK